MKKVLMLGTGGTIASEVTPSGLAPALTSAELLRCVPEISSLCSVTCEELFSIDSTNVTPAHWLTIARAMVEDAPILILDEATSSVDTRTEELIQKAMDALTVGRTSFVIAHRLSTIRDADMILVMNGGDIVERGTHEELLAKGGFYADIYNSQFTLAE